MVGVRTRAPITALDPKSVQRRPRYLNSYTRDGEGQLVRRTTGPEVWSAQSADKRWAYVRTEETTTPWEVTYLPTGQVVTMTTLLAGRRWTARDGGRYALASLLADAQRVLDRQGSDGSVLCFPPSMPEAQRAEQRRRAAQAAAERFALARRWCGVLEGLISPDSPDALCTGGVDTCSGYLSASVSGTAAAWVHADACSECAGEDLAGRRACRALYRHTACGDPEPVLCEHHRCSTPAIPVHVAGDCPAGRGACCGCCGYDQ
jgi:hypothetical protein